jgi:DNA-binding IclR family transcriptional regulator
MTTGQPTSSIQVIDRLVGLLRALADHEGGASLKYLCAETALHPSTAHRILSALQTHGLVERDANGDYRLGPLWTRLASRVRVDRDLRVAAQPVMEWLRDQVGETVNLTLREGDQVVYIDRALPNRMMRVEQLIGSRAPLHVTAVGKLMLAHGGEAACRDYARRTGLPRFTDNTLTDEQKLLEAAQAALVRGYAYDDEEAELGVGCLGVLIRDASGTPVAGLSISAPRERRQDSWIALLQDAAQRISDRL